MAGYPTDLRYTSNHQWLRAADKLVTVGVTEALTGRLGTIGFVELPYAGELFKPGDLIGRVSADGGSAALRMPVVGQINAVNQGLADAPGPINEDPYESGWILRIEAGRMADLDDLMDAGAYEAFVAGGGE